MLGREFVKAVVQNNGIAVIADIDEKAGSQAQVQLSLDHHTNRIDFLQLDINSKQSVEKMVDALNSRYGRIDALVNNAYPRNSNYGRHFFKVEYGDFCENLNLNLGGYFLVSQQLASYFEKQGHGNIVNVSSIYGVVAPKFEIYNKTSMSMPIEYAAIKSALIHLTKYMAKYFRGMNIRVNALSPGGIFDHQPTPFLNAYRAHCINKGMLDKIDICGTLIYLLSDLSTYVNGQNIVVDDGFSI